jgi:hypothetical protein
MRELEAMIHQLLTNPNEGAEPGHLTLKAMMRAVGMRNATGVSIGRVWRLVCLRATRGGATVEFYTSPWLPKDAVAKSRNPCDSSARSSAGGI